MLSLTVRKEEGLLCRPSILLRTVLLMPQTVIDIEKADKLKVYTSCSCIDQGNGFVAYSFNLVSTS